MIGTRLEHYEITAHLGSGGMGKVYQATDSKLGRSVAIKVLPEAFAKDADRVSRFEREARVLAALNHPHIAAIYGFERSAEQIFLVMELAPGDTLAQRIAQSRNGLPLDEVLSFARQIAQALEAAHQAGIIHRDLKPANIKITPDGTVKVLDFGLAKVMTPTDSNVDSSHSPTITNSAMTQAGVILGTAAYMSPEQAKGRAIDKRTDIWAFGCIVYEMLTGVRLFQEADVSETLAAVLMREPDWARIPSDVPRPIHTLLRRCMERDRAKRLSDVAGALFALDEALDVAPSTTAPELGTRSRFAHMGWIVAALIAIAASIAIAKFSRQPLTESPTMRLQIDTPNADPFTFALSPDGRAIVFRSAGNPPQLTIRRFDSGEERLLPGTEGSRFPFWSPDGVSLAFFTDGALKRIDVANGFVRKIATLRASERPGSWNRDGIILFSEATGPVYKVSATGGNVEQATALMPGQSSHRYSQFLPDGRRFLFLALGEPSVKGVYIGSLDNKQLTRLMDGEPAFTFLPPNFLVAARDGAVWAQRLDLQSGKPRGELLPVAPQILVDAQVNGLGALSASAAGSLAYRAKSETRQLVWLDRAGQQTGVLGEPDQWQVSINSFSSDGHSVALRRALNGNTDVWLMDTTKATLRRLTFDPAVDGSAVFSPDGNQVAYSSDPKGTLWDVYTRSADGTGKETPLATRPENEDVNDWSPDGRYILYGLENAQTSRDIWALPMYGDRKPFPVVQTQFYEGGSSFSPDGRWIAFTSSESGRLEVYAQPFPGPGPKIQISNGGGFEVRWPHKGHELFYRTLDNHVMAVPIMESGSSLLPGTPHPVLNLLPSDEYQPTPDGQRFLVNRVISPPSPISIILNWARGVQ
jgi:eukaryotic-like serine/threonine-protein kinase